MWNKKIEEDFGRMQMLTNGRLGENFMLGYLHIGLKFKLPSSF